MKERVMSMHTREVVNAICENHPYEYILLNNKLEILNCSNGLEKYIIDETYNDVMFDIFSLMPELVGMEEMLKYILAGTQKYTLIPQIWKDENICINVHIYQGIKIQSSLLILLEDISTSMKDQRTISQTNKENLLLMQEIAEKNKELKFFNAEMQRLVDEEVHKNLEKQHMLELQTRHAQMGEMISMITHQWRQPLSVIQTVGTGIKLKHQLGKLDFDMLIEKIDNILNQTKHMNQTVYDFQKFFIPSKDVSSFYVKPSIQTVLDLVKMEYTLRNIQITLEGDDEVCVEGYTNEFNQVILSIMQNAKEAFVGQEKKDKYIHIDVRKKRERVLVSIRDNAGGILETHVKEIFKQYVTSKKNGSGLGLYIAKSVIENNMHGKLWAQNTEVGAEFFVELQKSS